jgi:hypothetical protein
VKLDVAPPKRKKANQRFKSTFRAVPVLRLVFWTCIVTKNTAVVKPHSAAVTLNVGLARLETYATASALHEVLKQKVSENEFEW